VCVRVGAQQIVIYITAAAIVALGLFTAGATRPVAADSADGNQAPLYIRADRLFTGERLISGRVAVAVRDGRVVAAGRLRIPRRARVIRLRDATILPGIIDLHVHDSPEALLRTGVMTTRNLGAAERGLRPPTTRRGYPRIVQAGPMITVPGGYPTRLFPEMAAPVRSSEEAIATVRRLVRKGAAVIKISLETGLDGSVPTLTVEEIGAIVAEAHRLRRKVTAHVHEGKGVDLALAGGVDELAHMPCIRVTQEHIAALLEREIPVVGTLHAGELAIRRGLRGCELQAATREFVLRGGTLLYGTDIPAVPGRLDLTELGLMQRAGMTTTQVLRAATANAGEQLGMRRLGTLAPGAPADLWAVRGDPTRSLGALRRPVFLMARGRRLR
jgi:imidazolonepropionase-like amidohydrolase